jgi:ribonuclease HII
MKLPTKTIEKQLFSSGYQLIYAVDEVGMGCLAGPVVVCAVAMTNQFYKKAHNKLRWVRDSKLIQAKQREILSVELLKEKDLGYALAYSHPKTIDKLNIYGAARLAMKKAIQKLKPNTYNLKSIVLVDGKTKINDLKMEQLAIIKGDRKVFAIACASIIAKVHRDKMMTQYAKKYPGYGFEKHKGYGTKQHQTQLAALGPCSIHRKSFRLDY